MKNETEITDDLPRQTRVRFASITPDESTNNQAGISSTTTTTSTRIFPTTVFKRSRRKQTDLKLAFSEFYLMLILLQNYQQLNYMGFRKILKKHDKLFSTQRGENWR